MSAYNGVTGDALVTKVGNKEQQQKYSDNYDRIFKKELTELDSDTELDEKRINVIGQNGNDGLHYEWIKHDGSIECPVDKEATVFIETWASQKNYPKKAKDILWQYVKFYKVVN